VNCVDEGYVLCVCVSEQEREIERKRIKGGFNAISQNVSWNEYE